MFIFNKFFHNGKIYIYKIDTNNNLINFTKLTSNKEFKEKLKNEEKVLNDIKSQHLDFQVPKAIDSIYTDQFFLPNSFISIKV